MQKKPLKTRDSSKVTLKNVFIFCLFFFVIIFKWNQQEFSTVTNKQTPWGLAGFTHQTSKTVNMRHPVVLLAPSFLILLLLIFQMRRALLTGTVWSAGLTGSPDSSPRCPVRHTSTTSITKVGLCSEITDGSREKDESMALLCAGTGCNQWGGQIFSLEWNSAELNVLQRLKSRG